MRTGHIFFVGLALLGCGDDAATVTLADPAELSLIGAKGPGAGEPALGGCVEVGEDPKRTAFVVIQVANYDLRPPGACRGQSDCGAVSVQLTDEANETFETLGVVSHVPVEFSTLPLGAYEIEVSLLDDGASRTQGECTPGPCTSELIRFAESCGGAKLDAGLPPAPPDAQAPVAEAGVDASADSGSDAPEAGTADAGEAGDSGANADASAAAPEAGPSAPTTDAQPPISANDGP